jgi:hypothetical protein
VHAEGGGSGALAMAVRPKCRWDLVGLRLGQDGVRVEPSGSAQEEGISLFF